MNINQIERKASRRIPLNKDNMRSLIRERRMSFAEELVVLNAKINIR